MKILIAVPTFESIFPDTFKSIYDLDKGEHEVSFEFVRGYDCATARNKIVQLAIDRKSDYVFMVDNDVVLPKDALLNLLEDQKDVLLGYYPHRDNDNVYSGRTCILKLCDENGQRYFNYTRESMYMADELNGSEVIQIHGGGMGCALIKTDVFLRIQFPWYDWVNYQDKGMLSEDLYFCEQCRKVGIPIYTDTRVSCGHMLRHVQFVE